MNKIYKLILYVLGLPKTLYFNFKYLPFYQAVKLPIFISHRVILKNTKGTIKLLPIQGEIKPALIKIGFGDVGIFDNGRSRSIWECSGEVCFYGQTNIGHGSKICVGPNGTLEFGNAFDITAESQIVCFKHIVFGEDVLVSWQCLVIDTDFHKITYKGIVTNLDKEIKIGNHVWIGCRSIILKGVNIPDNVVVAANSNVVGNFKDKYSIIGGNPAKVIKHEVDWER